MASTSWSRVSLGKISIMSTRVWARFESVKPVLSLFGSSSLFASLLEFEELSDELFSELCFVECEEEAAHGWCELSRENAERFRWYANSSKLNSDIFSTCQPSVLLLCWWINSDLELYSMPEIFPGHSLIASENCQNRQNRQKSTIDEEAWVPSTLYKAPLPISAP